MKTRSPHAIPRTSGDPAGDGTGDDPAQGGGSALYMYISVHLSMYLSIYLSISTSIRYLFLYLTYIYIHAGLFWSKTKKLKVQTFWRGKAIESAFIVQFVLSHADIISIRCKASFANEAFFMQLELF